MPGLWTHDWIPVSFSLVVDDFGFKYVGEEHALHLLNVLKEHCEVKVDWNGNKYCGINLEWDYKRRQVHLFMQKYVQKVLKHFQHECPTKPQHVPHPHEIPVYGQTKQCAKEEDKSRPLTKGEKCSYKR